MDFKTVLPYLLMIILGASFIGVFIYIGVTSGNQDNAVQVNKQIGIVGGVTTALSVLFGILTYFYFSVNTDYLTPFLLISNSLNLTLSLVAVAISSLRINAQAQG